MAISLRTLFNAGKERLGLELITGEPHLDRTMEEHALNRPGLALTGFFQYFAQHRLQVFGLAEFTYLKSLPPEERIERVRAMLKKNVPGIVIARSRHLSPWMKELADEFRTPVFRTPLITSHFVKECTLVIEEITAPRKREQGTMLEIKGIGVLIKGPAGIGKSEAALSLIMKGYSLVSDDVTEVMRVNPRRLVTYASDVTRYHMEIRGLGIIHVPSIFGISSVRREAALDLVISLHPYKDDADEERTGIVASEIEILGVRRPHYSLPVSSGRDMANIIEATALDYKLKLLGHDAAKELDDKLVEWFLRKTER